MTLRSRSFQTDTSNLIPRHGLFPSFNEALPSSQLFFILSLPLIGEREPITVGQHRQLFIDDYIIESMEDVSRRLNTVSKHPNNPLVIADQAWEGHMAVPQGSVIYDSEDRIYKMWYTTDIQSKGKGFAYAVSQDGINWDKPAMDIVLKNGKKNEPPYSVAKHGVYVPALLCSEGLARNKF